MFFIILTLLITRPFIASLAFPFANAIHSILLLAALAAWLLIKRGPRLPGTIRYPLVLFFLALLLSFISSVNLMVSSAELYKYSAGVMLFLAAATFSTEERDKALLCMVISASVISLLALNQYFFG
ncbi:MAG TPA: hypothetical protein VMD04_01335, partial [Candidatus Margulisiibacteriota bacterium]|nr:hypothetical protein [Candidatus Margulisiibacteriota bacterium]